LAILVNGILDLINLRGNLGWWWKWWN